MTSGSENNPDLSFNINTCTGMPTNDIFYSCVNPDYMSFRARLANNTPGYVGLGCTTQDVTDPKNPIYAEFCNV